MPCLQAWNTHPVVEVHTRAGKGKATMASRICEEHAKHAMGVQEADTADSIDWEAVRVAPTDQVSLTIQVAQSYQVVGTCAYCLSFSRM